MLYQLYTRKNIINLSSLKFKHRLNSFVKYVTAWLIFNLKNIFNKFCVLLTSFHTFLDKNKPIALLLTKYENEWSMRFALILVEISKHIFVGFISVSPL